MEFGVDSAQRVLSMTVVSAEMLRFLIVDVDESIVVVDRDSNDVLVREFFYELDIVALEARETSEDAGTGKQLGGLRPFEKFPVPLIE